MKSTPRILVLACLAALMLVTLSSSTVEALPTPAAPGHHGNPHHKGDPHHKGVPHHKG
ncbi:hypothetical protein CPC16_007925, partial [Podila verticillata]